MSAASGPRPGVRHCRETGGRESVGTAPGWGHGPAQLRCSERSVKVVAGGQQRRLEDRRSSLGCIRLIKAEMPRVRVKSVPESEKIPWLGLLAQNRRWSQGTEALGEINVKSSSQLPNQGARSRSRSKQAGSVGALAAALGRGRPGPLRAAPRSQKAGFRSYYPHGARCLEDADGRQGRSSHTGVHSCGQSPAPAPPVLSDHSG